jgi:Cd2+/Zn2+-exporting ATPase
MLAGSDFVMKKDEKRMEDQADSKKPSRIELKISGMDCPDCALTIEKDIAAMEGVRKASVDFLGGKLSIEGSRIDAERIKDRIGSLGYSADRIERKGDENIKKTVLQIPEMDCADEERIIRKALLSLDSVTDLQFNLIETRVTVLHRGQVSVLVDAIRRDGFEAKIVDGGRNREERALPPWRLRSVIVASLLVALGAVLHYSNLPGWLFKTSILLGVAVGGWKIGHKGLIAAQRLRLDMNFLMSSAVIGAIIIGQWIEAGTVIVLFAIAQLLESHSLDRSRRAIKGLIDLSPQTAIVIRDGSEFTIPVEEVRLDDTVLVKPGARIPVDGSIVSGYSSINQAPITGESLPAGKTVGDKVYAATINGEGALEIKAEHIAGDTTLDRIIDLVEKAQAQRAPSQSFVDRFAAIYTPAVVATAVLTATVPPLLFGAGWLDWIYRSLALLVIACPCALVISTPVTIVSALTAAARNGVLIKGGAYIENLHKIGAVAFDKTGTITLGIPAVREVVPLSDMPETEILRLAASIESRSEHPIGAAITGYAQERGIQTASITDFKSIPGRGAEGVIDGRKIYVGNHSLIEELGVCSSSIDDKLRTIENESQSAVVIATSSTALGIIAVADKIRPDSVEAVTELKALGVRYITMLTGDNKVSAKAVGDSIGIERILAELLPDQKVEAIRSIESEHGSVVMVGDGINDAPALAASKVGIAMGAAGSDVALETADIALMSDEPSKIPWAYRLSRKAYRIIKANIAMAIAIKAVFIILALMGLATLWMAVFADMGVSLMVIINGMRALHVNQA